MGILINALIVCLACIACFREVHAGLSCLACTDSPRSRDCEYTTRCGTHESCFTDTYVTTVGTIRHSMGCRDTKQCDVKLPMVGRSTNNILICSECCQNNLCNSGLCGAEPGYLNVPLTSRGPICFSCDQQLATGSCHVIKECGIQEECMLEKFETQVGHDVIYQTDCVHITTCEEKLRKYQRQAAAANNLVGRRSTSQDSCLLKCCRSDLCNEDCTGSRVIFPSSTGQSLPTISSQTSAVSATSTSSASASTAPTTSSTAPTTSSTTSSTSTSVSTTVATTPSTLPSTSSPTTTITCYLPRPDADFCRDKDSVQCPSTLNLCYVTVDVNRIYRNSCILKKAMCDEPELVSAGCNSC